jgi:transcriptional/translational regulatory protein YebC/TACO1
MFHQKGLITVKTDKVGEDDLMEIALSAGAEDMRKVGEIYEITSQPVAFEGLKKALEAKSIPMELAEVARVASSEVPVTDVETARKIVALMDEFDENEDIQNASSNFNIPDDIMAKVAS